MTEYICVHVCNMHVCICMQYMYVHACTCTCMCVGRRSAEVLIVCTWPVSPWHNTSLCGTNKSLWLRWDFVFTCRGSFDYLSLSLYYSLSSLLIGAYCVHARPRTSEALYATQMHNCIEKLIKALGNSFITFISVGVINLLFSRDTEYMHVCTCSMQSMAHRCMIVEN